MEGKNKIVKYLIYFISLLLFFILCLKTLGIGFRHLTGSSGPLSWQEIWISLPKYIIGSSFVMLFIIYLDYIDSKKKK